MLKDTGLDVSDVVAAPGGGDVLVQAIEAGFSEMRRPRVPFAHSADGEPGAAETYAPVRADPAVLLEAVPCSGFVRDYVDWVRIASDAPEHFHLPAALTCVAAALGNRVYVPFGTQDVYPNLYALLLCPSSRYRKSSVMAPVRRLLGLIEVYPDSVSGPEADDQSLLLPSQFSPEAFFETLSERPEGAIVWGELGGALANMGRSYMAGTAEFLTEAYDVPPRMERRLRKERFVIERPAFTILAASTPEWLTSHLPEETAIGGFLPRFAIFGADQPGELMPLPSSLDPDAQSVLADDLRGIREAYPSGTPARMEIGSVQSEYIELAHELDRARSGGRAQALRDAFITRLGPLSLKLALLFEAAARPGAVELAPQSFACARSVCLYLRQYVDVLISETTWTEWGAWRKKALNAIRDAGPTGIARNALTRGALRDLDKRQRDQLLEALDEDGVVVVTEGPPVSRGQRATVYTAADLVPWTEGVA